MLDPVDCYRCKANVEHSGFEVLCPSCSDVDSDLLAACKLLVNDEEPESDWCSYCYWTPSPDRPHKCALTAAIGAIDKATPSPDKPGATE